MRAAVPVFSPGRMPPVLRAALMADGPLDGELVRVAMDRWTRAWAALGGEFDGPTSLIAARVAKAAREERTAGVKVR